MDVQIMVTVPENEVKKQQDGQGNATIDFTQMSSTIRTTLDEIKNPQAQPAYKPSQKKPWVYHGTRKRHFNSNSYATFTIKLKTLQNLRTKSTESVADFMVSVFFKGRQYGAFLSGPVDLESLTALTRHKKRSPTYLHAPKVTLSHEIKLNLRFADLVDGPVVLTVASIGEIPEADIALAEPFAYTSLNIINLVKKGKSRELLRPLYCVPGKTPYGILLGFPFIELEVTNFAGLPNPEQLKQGNIMTCVVESMYRLPPEIQALQNNPSNEFEVFLTLPHSSSENVFHYPAGILQKVIPAVVAEIFDKANMNEEEVEEELNVAESKIQVQATGILNESNGVPVFLEQKHGAHRHWASLMQYHPEAPRGTSVVTGKKRIIKLTHDKYCLAGDVAETGDTSWRGYLNSSDTRLVWNSLHRRYMGLEAYKHMLQRLAKQVIWPLEIAVTVRKERPAKKQVSNSSMPKKEVSSSKKEGGSESEGNNNRGSLPPEAEEPQFEFAVVYHGVAFLDMTKLLHPGAKRAHYACRLYKFDEAVFMASTCAMKSAFLSSLQSANIDYVVEDGRIINQAERQKTPPQAPAPDKKQRKSDAKKDVSPPKPVSPVGKNKENKNQKQEQTNEDDSANFPFIVFQIRMNRSLVPPIARDKKGIHKCATDYLPMRRFPRKKLMNSTLAQKKFRHSVLEAAAEMSHQFHNEYLDYIVKEGVSRAYLDPRSPSSSFENIKKGFLFYLNASGRYLVLREHLRHAVSNIIQQKCTILQPRGFKSRREFQNFLHDMYLYLVDEMHETLNTTALQEVDPLAGGDASKSSKRNDMSSHNIGKDLKKKCKKSHRSKKAWVAVQNLLMFAQESFAQSDYENSHRLHVERVARSGESSECWADFAVMWLSRGDDRLAEIAIRESLLKNEKNLKALIISGVIAARHNDSRAITCLGAALRLRPISPEILVLIGAAHACLGNDVASEYFFKKARYVHHLLTGKDTSMINNDFSQVNAKWDLQEAVASLEKAFPPRRLTIRADRGSIPIPSGVLPAESELEKESKNVSTTIDEEKTSKKKKGSNSNAKRKDTIEVIEGELNSVRDESKSEQTTFKPFAHRPQYEFPVEELVIKNRRAIKFAKLPSMGPSIIQVWNVTKLSKRFSSKPKKSGFMIGNSQTDVSGEPPGWQPNQQSWEEMENMGLEDEDGREEMFGEDYPEEYGEDFESVSEFDQDQEMNLNQGDQNPKPRHIHRHKKFRKVISRRLGSEYIWTAHILLKLRLFDFLDGILARELTFNEKREIPFLYVRALSLHLRQRDGDALDFIHEALEIQPDHPILWALNGHCHYNMRETDAAMQSYKKTLKLPHGHENMQLVYLRFGSLCLEKGNVKLAKKIFLKGVHSFPSPYMWMATGNICFHLKEYSQAETAFAEANRLDNTNPIIWAHLSLVSMAKGHKTLAEQSYKWAIRFGLKKCRLMDEIKELHRKKGYGNPGFPRIPHCIPHEYYLKRLGRDRPFEEYKDALKFPKPKQRKNKHGNTHRENELIKKLKRKAEEINAKLELSKEQEKLPAAESTQGQLVVPELEQNKSSVTDIKIDVPVMAPRMSIKNIPPHEKDKHGKKGKIDGKTRTAPVGSGNIKFGETPRRKSSQK